VAGRFDAAAWHPGTAAPLYVQNQIREVSVAIPAPRGMYSTSAGRDAITTTKQFARENPDLVKAFLVAWDRTVRWLYANNGAHLDEAATITSRALRSSKSIALFKLKDESQTAYSWGTNDAQEAVDSIKKFIQYEISFKDPFFTKYRISDREIEELVDRRFFAGGEYFVDASPRKSAQRTN
jgi:sulfonate transport system substrate-binding protein